MYINLHFVYAAFMLERQLSDCIRHRMASIAQNVYYLTLDRRSLLIPGWVPQICSEDKVIQGCPLC